METYQTSKAKENILRRIRASLQDEKLARPFPEVERSENVFTPLSMPSIEETFALEFNKAGGRFSYCEDIKELAQTLKIAAPHRDWQEVVCADKKLFPMLIEQKLSFIREYSEFNQKASVCITSCEVGIARTGSLFFSSRQNFGRSASISFPIHIAILYANQLVVDIKDGLSFLKKKYQDELPSMMCMNTGTAFTDAIEKERVKEAQGPKEIYCFLVHSKT